MKTALLIVNPNSGKRKGEKQAVYIRRKLAEAGLDCSVFVSRDLDSLHHFLDECALERFDLAGLVGGDGTMHAFMNRVLARYERVPLPVALFPCGTGNAFNFDIGCSSIDETLKTILSNSRSYIDVAEVHCGSEMLWSFNILGCGLVTDINRLAERLRFLGSSRYTVASLIKLLKNPVRTLKISTEQGFLEERFSFVLACNTRYTGKGMLMAPHARLNDGKFDVIVVKACSMFTLLRLFPKLFKGKHLGAKELIYLQTDRLEVSSGGISLDTNIDGELKGHTPFTLRVHPDIVQVFVQ
ncbi:MAG TPA: diacylglycerol kinase family lipid kinase [Bacteroidia bacterium]|nr:diacylglycerol kinase family lipid kinase [Bacteroidia bacterium]